jgi:hypothetical protein
MKHVCSFSVTLFGSHFCHRPVAQEGSLEIQCGGCYWERSVIVRFCTALSCLSSVESFYIFNRRSYQQDLGTQYDIENAGEEWLDFLRPFTAVKDIYLCETSAQHNALVLQENAEGRLTEVLPTLQNIFLPPSGPIQEGIVHFVAAQELSGHPIAVSAGRQAVGGRTANKCCPHSISLYSFMSHSLSDSFNSWDVDYTPFIFVTLP